MNPALRAVLLSPAFNPLHLFRSGAQGWWFDNSDLATMFQDSAGTTPVTAVGQPVGKQLDKSGLGNHRVQATAASRPTLQQTASGLYYLDWDGVDDSMALASAIDLTGTAKLTFFAGVTKDADTDGVITELSATVANNGTFLVSAASGGGANYFFRLNGTSGGAFFTTITFTAPHTAVLTASFDISAADRATEIIPRINGVINQTGAGGSVNAGTGNFGNHIAYFGRRNNASIPFNGREFGNICVGRTASDTEIARAERWLNARTGAY